ncbi:MAG: YdcF family protein [Verrucomicrobiota bacterium]
MIPPRRSAGFLWLLLPTVVCVVLLLASIPSLLIAKKVVGLLVLPAGLVWLGLLAMVGWPGLNRWGRAFATLLLVVYTVAGNAWTGAWLLGRLESPYAAMAHPPQPFDAICVLGGGTSATPNGYAQLGPAGDRLIVSARMFLAGKTRHLVASGLSVTDIGGSRSLADDTAAVWLDLGIPETAITRLSTPRTTAEEIRAYKELISANAWKRVAVCSSAWHLRRVEKICRKQGVGMVPVPSDFLSSPLPWTPMYAVPQSRGFQNVQKALWEYLGSFTGG